MLVKTNNKEQAFQAVINVWLKDPAKYCNTCGEPWKEVKCCENQYGSNKTKTMRSLVSIPTGLYYMLDGFKRQNGQKGLFQEPGEDVWFAKKFKWSAIPERI
jgi:hypothetical protein